MESRTIESPADLRALIGDIATRSLPFQVTISNENNETVNFGDDQINREFQSVRNRGNLPSLSERQYVNQDDRERDRRFNALLEGLWTHRGAENGSAGAVVVANVIENAHRARNLPEIEQRVVQHNPPPEGRRVESIQEIFRVPGSHIVLEDGDLTAGLEWSSDLDGVLGTGGSVAVSTLSVGDHTITVSVTDSQGEAGTYETHITINAAPTVSIMQVKSST